jgi:hypothetical protein
MKKHSMPEMKESGVNVTPLIDIIMCLIVFFMLVTKVGVSRGVDKSIKLPNLIYGAKISDMGDTLTINVHKPTNGVTPQVTTIVGSALVDLPIFIDATGQRPLRIVLTEFKKTHLHPRRLGYGVFRPGKRPDGNQCLGRHRHGVRNLKQTAGGSAGGPIAERNWP